MYKSLLKTSDKAKYNEIVCARVREAAKDHDLLVLAQGSIYHLMPLLGNVPALVLTSLETCVAQIRGALGVV